MPAEELDTAVRHWADELLGLIPTVLKKSFGDSLAPIGEQLDRFRVLDLVNPDFFTSGEQDEEAKAFLETQTPDFSAVRWAGR